MIPRERFQALMNVEPVDWLPVYSLCLDWMLGVNGKLWSGPLLLQPEDGRVVIRDSTVPGTKKPRRLS